MRPAAVYRDQDFFVDYSGQRRILLAPSLTWKPTPDTTLTLLGRYVDDHINPWSPTTAYGTALPNPNGELFALGRVGLPADIGGAVAAILSDDMGRANGTCFDISGGQML